MKKKHKKQLKKLYKVISNLDNKIFGVEINRDIIPYSTNGFFYDQAKVGETNIIIKYY